MAHLGRGQPTNVFLILNLQIAASGTTHNGTVAYTEPGDTTAIAGQSTHVGTIAKTEGADTSAIAGAPTRLGTVAKTEGADTSTISGSVGTGSFIASVSGTKILDQNGQPYWIQGCSPQLMAVKGLHTDFDAYFSAVAALGYNAAQVMSCTDNANGGNVGGVNANGDAPFGTASTFASPVTAYWNLIDDLVTTAAGYGITVFLAVVDNISAFGGNIGSMSSTNATNYGTFLGNRYKTATNIVWIVGNDYLSSQWAGRDANYKHVMDAIAAAGDAHIMTAWFDTPVGASGTGKDNTAWDTYTDLAGIYTYANTYTSYRASIADTTPTIPVYGQEMSYDGEKNTVVGPPSTSKHALRRFSWEAATCGARGAFFGQHDVWTFDGSQLTAVADAASAEQAIVTTTVKAIGGWETLANNASLISGGAGTADNTTGANYETDTFATAAITSDGKHAICYFPNNRGSVTLDLTQMTSGTKVATWLDPSNGSTSSESTPASPTMPGSNHDGDADWVLLVNVTGQSGTVAVTEGPDASAIAGAPTRIGTVAKTEVGDTSAISGTIGQTISGTVAVTEAADSPSIAGHSTHVGTIAKTEAPDSPTITGRSTHVGTIAITEARDIPSIAGHPGTFVEVETAQVTVTVLCGASMSIMAIGNATMWIVAGG